MIPDFPRLPGLCLLRLMERLGCYELMRIKESLKDVILEVGVIKTTRGTWASLPRNSRIPPLTIIHLIGQIDSPERLESVTAVAVSPETEYVAILMESVEYINSRGCGSLIALHHQVEKRGFQVFVVSPVGRVARVMKRLGCYRLLRIRQSLGETITEVEMVLQLAKEQMPV